MGLVSIMFWITDTVATATWAHRTKSTLQNHLTWTTVKIIHFPLVQIFQIYIFKRVHVSSCTNNKVFLKMKTPYFLVPFLALTSLALVVNLIICEYRFYVGELVHDSKLIIAAKILHAVGSPMGIAFTVHIALHFYTVYYHMTKWQHDYQLIAPKDDSPVHRTITGDTNDNDSLPLLERQFSQSSTF